MNKYRRYTKHIHNGKNILVSWIQRRCIKCQRFINNKTSKEVCSKCAKTNRKIYRQSEKSKDYQRAYSFLWWRKLLKYYIGD